MSQSNPSCKYSSRSWQLPHKPDDLDLVTWQDLIRRSDGCCECSDDCPSQCDTRLEVDHIHSRALGGETSLANCRLICASKNRERAVANDPKWEKPLYFDDLNSFAGLREMQMSSGPEMVRRYADLFLGDNRLRLLNVISLFPLVCGAGKTLLMIGVLLAINEQVNARLKNAPRVGKVLWFVKERELAVMLKNELEDEICRYNLHHSKPDVQICSEPGDLEKGALHHDITIACPHALWERKNQSRNDNQVEITLSAWDTIIWDECDFAGEQLKRLASLSGHALKFGLTASPLDADGVMLKHFVLAGFAAYQDVYLYDKCLKRLLPWDEALEAGFIKVIKHDGFSHLDRGSEVARIGQHGQHSSLPGSMATIRTAIYDCSQIEEQMHREWPNDWYSPHILVVCNSQDECEHLCKQTNEQLDKLNLFGDGWRATAIYDGMKTAVPEESHLFHRDKNKLHPFMRAKTRELRGRCDKKSARILFVVDMAIRGMNCWPLLFVVDIKRGNSINVQVQLKGRDHRWPASHKHLFDDQRFKHFCTGRYYRPESGGASGEMEAAYSFILEMEQRIEDANLLQWSDLLEGRTIDANWQVQGTTHPFSTGDRVQVDGMIGQIVRSGGGITQENIDHIISSLPGDMPQGRRERAIEHITNVIDPSPSGSEYRAKLIDTDNVEVIKPISREEPKRVEDYDFAELTTFAQTHGKWSDCFSDILPELANEKSIVRKMVAKELRERDIKLYRPVANVFQLQSADGKIGILNRISARLGTDLIKRGAIHYSDRGQIQRMVNTAASIVGGMRGVKGAAANDGPLDQPGYHHAFMLPNVQRQIKDLAVALLMKCGALTDAAVIYSDVLGEDNVAAE